MHSATQIIAQRAPPAIRTKPRWQPYHSVTPALPPRSPTTSYLNTQSNVSPQTPSTSYIATSAREPARPPPPTPTPAAQLPKDLSQRDTTKHKFAAGLIDQAVHIISEIWRPQDIPELFKAPTKGLTAVNPLGNLNPTSGHPFTHPSQPSTSAVTQALLASKAAEETNLLPMKTFVHEVLKRSRTSASILQAALCYLEAIRPRVPEILAEERRGIRAQYRPDSTILPATAEEVALDAELSHMESLADYTPQPSSFQSADDIDMTTAQVPLADETKTIRVSDCDDMDASQSSCGSNIISSVGAEASMDSISTPIPSSQLPSPLLCPRRAFLASLILASKFFQDKCYSNRAWAKLSGLPPREIGRCERALGEALQWRLWVGKNPVAPQAAPSPPSARPIVRSQTESSLITASSSEPAASGSRPDHKPLRKASTLPTEAFSANVVPKDNSWMFMSQTAPTGARDSTETMSNSVGTSTTVPLSCSQQCESPENIVLEKSASSSPGTPGLTYSPSSTDSSGDHTVQMSSFEDNVFPLYVSQLWSDIASDVGPPTSEAMFYGLGKRNGNILATGYCASKTGPISIVSPEPAVFGAQHMGDCLWHMDNHCIAFETASVH